MLQMKECFIVDFDFLDYDQALDFQTKIRTYKEKNRSSDNYVLLLQHNHVFTLGKRGNEQDILVKPEILEREQIKVIKIERGGQVTYHGPGQFVAYFLLDLLDIRISVKDFVWKMEEIIIKILKEHKIEGFREVDYPGVWVVNEEKKEKIAAIGAQATNKITSHGFALNVNTNMNYFNMIVPCGITQHMPTSMQQLLYKKIDINEIYFLFRNKFEEVFNIKLNLLQINEFKERVANFD